jgi:hypothetical protein
MPGDQQCHWNWAVSQMAVQALLVQWLRPGQSFDTGIKGSMSGIGRKVNYHAQNMTDVIEQGFRTRYYAFYVCLEF